MAAIGFLDHSKSVTLPKSGVTYSYVSIRPDTPGKPTVLFLHGFPSSSWDWRWQIRHFSSKGYGVLVPDLLGYGGSDKPSDPTAYTMKKIAGHVAEILEHEGLDRVFACGHDFGAILLGRLANYHGDKLIALAFLSVPYVPPTMQWDIDALKPITEQVLGFEKLGYMRFMAREDSPAIIEAHSKSFDSLLYTDNHDNLMNFFPAGALEKYITSDRIPSLSAHVTPEEMATHHEIFAAGGYRGPTNWYRVLLGGLGIEEEKSDALDPSLKVPVLFITETPGPATMPGSAEQTKQFAADFRVSTVSTKGHWVQLESRDEVNKTLEKFFEEVDAASASKL